MPNWENGCIYMLRHADDVELENIYIGSTTNFRGRKYQHKNSCNHVNHKDHNHPKYQYIRYNGGWDEWKMVWIEDYPCKSKRELLLREDEVMLQYKNILNKLRAHTTDEQKKEYNKEYQKEYQKEYRQDNREKIAEYGKERYKNNCDKIIEQQKEYYQNNRDKVIENVKEYYQTNREKILEKNKEKVKCDICGCESSRNHLARHQKTKKCINYKKSTYT